MRLIVLEAVKRHGGCTKSLTLLHETGLGVRLYWTLHRLVDRGELRRLVVHDQTNQRRGGFPAFYYRIRP